MNELAIAWSEITIRELNDLTEELHGVLEIDGDRQTARILYEGARE